VAIAVVATVAVLVSRRGEDSTRLEVVTLARGEESKYRLDSVDVSMEVIRTAAEGQDFWSKHDPSGSLGNRPSVNFSTSSVVAVLAYGGYDDGVTVQRVTASGDDGRVRAHVRHTPAADDCNTLDISLTHFHIVRVSPAVPPSARVELDVDTDVRNCP